MPNITTNEGIIIRSFPSGDNDLVLRVITKNFGKLALFVRNVRNSKKKYPSGLDLFDHGEFAFIKKAEILSTLSSFRSYPTFRTLRENLDKLYAASFLAECFDLFMREDSENHPDTFDVLKLSLSAINDAADLKQILKACYISLANLLRHTGFENSFTKKSASLKNMHELIQMLEALAEKPLVTSSGINDLLNKLSDNHSLNRTSLPT